MTEPYFVFSTAIKTNPAVYFIFNYWLHEFDAKSFHIYIFLTFGYIFFHINLLPFENLSHFTIIDIYHVLGKNVRKIVDKVFREKLVE